MGDAAHKQTDKLLNRLKKDVHGLYKSGHKDLKAKVLDIAGKMNFNANVTAAERFAEANKYGRLDKLIDEVSTSIIATNTSAVSLTNGLMSEVYELNYNSTAAEFEKKLKKPVKKAGEVNEEIKTSPLTQIAIDNLKNKKYIESQLKPRLLGAIAMGGALSAIIASVDETVDLSLNSSIKRTVTETTRIENTARQNVYDDVAKKHHCTVVKRWVTQMDDKVRDAHARAEGQTVKYDKPFHVMGEEIFKPGDEGASIGNWINCRCSMEGDIID